MKRKIRTDRRGDLDISLDFQGHISSLSKNISQSGMLCKTSRRVEEMTLLDIRFQLPEMERYSKNNTWIECSGVVVRCEKVARGAAKHPYEVAIFFDNISERNRNILSNYVMGKKI